VLFLPSSLIDLRIQKSLFPMMGAYLLLCGAVYLFANRPVGLLGGFILFYVLVMFIPDSYTFLLISVFYLAAYLIIVAFYDRLVKPVKERIYDTLCIFALINVAWMVMQHHDIFIIFYPKNGVSLETGWFANRNETAAYLAMATPLFLRGYWHWGLIPMAIGFYLAQCANGVLTVSIVLCIYGVYWLCKAFPKYRMIIPVACIVAAVFTTGTYMTFVHRGGYSERITAYVTSLELVKEKPLFGWGIGQSCRIVPIFLHGEKIKPDVGRGLFKHVYYQKDFARLYGAKHNYNNEFVESWTHLHNDHLQWMIDAGMVGFGLWFMVVLAHFVAAFRTGRFEPLPVMVLLAAMISANAFFTFQIGCFLFIAVLFAGMIQGEYVSQRRSHG
jgi:O-antigen ligase